MYIDALVVKIKDGAHVRNKAAHLVIGVDVDGQRHVLGISDPIGGGGEVFRCWCSPTCATVVSQMS